MLALAFALTSTSAAALQPTDTGAASAPSPVPPPPPLPPAPPPAAAPEAPPATTPTPAPPEGSSEPEASAESAQDTVDWAEREREVGETNTLTGGSGLLRTQHAESGAPGQFRLGFVGEWFSAGFLCTAKYPCVNPNGGAALTSDTMNHVGGTLSLGVSIAKLGPGTLEGYASTTAYANSDGANRPGLLQVLGDTNLGLKYGAPLGHVLSLGAFSELWLINGSGAVGLDGGGTSAKFAAVGTADFRGLESHVPLRFSTNVEYVLDNTGAVLAATEAARGTPVTRIERYGLGVNRVDHVDLFFGLEGLFLDERIRPFVEAHVLIPSNRQKYECHPDNPSSDSCLAFDRDVPSTLTIGARFFPWKRGFSLLAAVDIGLSGTKNFIEELQPVAPWTLFLGGGWAVDTWDRPPPKAVEKYVEGGGPKVHVVGYVHEKDKNDPVVGAIVAYRDHAELSPLATGPDGKFWDDVSRATYTLEIHADGYKPGNCDLDATRSTTPAAAPAGASAGAAAPSPPSASGEIDVDCPLEALPRVGVVTGHVRDADTGQPLPGIQLVLTDVQRTDHRLVSDATGGFSFPDVPSGAAELSVIADGYLALVTPTDVKPRQETTVDLLLRPKPRLPKVQVTAKEITIREQVQFALDSAVILPQSFGLLTEVADTLIRHPELARVEVQGHTDNSGTPEHNQTLSDDRAEAVRVWLVQHGVGPDRLAAHGYGQEKPLVPNSTPESRGRNRRVQFIILERGGSSTMGKLQTPTLAPAASSPPAPPSPSPAPSGAAPPSPPNTPNPAPLPGF